MIFNKVKIITPLSEEYNEKDNHYIEMTKGIKVLFYDSALNVASTLTSNYAIQQVSKK